MFYIVLAVISMAYSIDETILINSSSFSDWKYFSFSSGNIQEIIVDNPEENFDWDLGVMRNHYRTNSGKSGIAYGGVIVDSSSIFTDENWDDLNSIEGVVNFSQDGILDNIYDIISHTYSEAPGSNVFESWGWFDFDNNYQFNVNNYKYVLRTAHGENLVKIWIKDYYNDLGQSAHITLRYSTDMDCQLDECGICNGDGSLCQSSCSNVGDINGDGGYNILDVVELVNCVISGSCENLIYECAADLNEDGGYNVLDIVALVNCILSATCMDI